MLPDTPAPNRRPIVAGLFLLLTPLLIYALSFFLYFVDLGPFGWIARSMAVMLSLLWHAPFLFFLALLALAVCAYGAGSFIAREETSRMGAVCAFVLYLAVFVIVADGAEHLYAHSDAARGCSPESVSSGADHCEFDCTWGAVNYYRGNLIDIFVTTEQCPAYGALCVNDRCTGVDLRTVTAPATCLQIGHDSDPDAVIFCLRDLAIRQRNASICGLSPTLATTSCYLPYLNAIGRLDCKLLTGSAQAQCAYTMALLRNESTWCAQAGGASDACYGDLATVTANGTLCAAITAGVPRDGCYMGVAALRRDPSWCDNVSPSLRDSCVQAVPK